MNMDWIAAIVSIVGVVTVLLKNMHVLRDDLRDASITVEDVKRMVEDLRKDLKGYNQLREQDGVAPIDDEFRKQIESAMAGKGQ